MSGGSYDYFCWRAPEALWRISGDLQSMSARCLDPEAWKHEGVDAQDLEAVGAYLGALALKVDGLARALSKLAQVTHDIEWWQSGDSGVKRVVESFKQVQETTRATR